MPRRHGCGRGQRFKDGAHLGFHGCGIEVAEDADDQLAFDGALVPGLQVGKGDGGDCGELRLAGVGAVGAVVELAGFSGFVAVLVVVETNNGSSCLMLS